LFRKEASSFLPRPRRRLPTQVGWEEEAEAAVTHLLRTSLARNAKEAAAAVPPLAAARDTARLRRHVGLVLERLGQGMRLAGGGGQAAAV
jgi:Bardet-Biedl syndrome 9 protein